MKRVQLEKHLRSLGCVFVKYGARHEQWQNPITLSIAMIPRHAEIKAGTVAGICKSLDVPKPSER